MKKLNILLLTIVSLSIYEAAASSMWNIQGIEYSVDTISHFYSGPGTTQTQLKLTSGNTVQKLYYTTTNLLNPYITIKVGTAGDGILGIERTKTDPCGDEILSKMITHRKEFISGVNADFFGTIHDSRHYDDILYHVPFYGHAISDGEPYYIRPQASENSICITNDNKVIYGKANYTSTVTIKDSNGKIKNKSKLVSINTNRGEDYLTLYTNRLNTYNHGTRTNNAGSEAYLKKESGTLTPGNTLTLRVENVRKDIGNMSVSDTNHFVLSGHESEKNWGNGNRSLIGNLVAQSLSQNIQGDIVEISPQLTIDGITRTDITQMTAGMPMILRNGEVLDTQTMLNHLTSAQPRTAVGSSENKLVMLVVDGRGQAGSKGVTSYELADIMIHLGCTDALNFDGGGSSEMYDRNFGIINSPSDGREREVINGLFVATTNSSYMEDKTIQSIRFKVSSLKIKNKASFTPIIMGYNKYGVLVNKDIKDFTLTCHEDLGSINGTTIIGSGINGTHALTARYGNAVATIPVTIYGGSDTTVPSEPSTNEPLTILTQISETPIASCKGNNGTQAIVSGGKLWIYNPSNKELNWYKFDKVLQSGQGRIGAGGIGANAFTFDEANHLIIRSATYFDIWDFNYDTGDRKWVAKIKVGSASSGEYIAAVGNILNGGYIIAPAHGKLQKISKGKLLVNGGSEYDTNITNYNINHITDTQNEKTYIHHLGNGQLLINSLKTDFFTCNVNGTNRFDVGDQVLGKAFDNTLNKIGKVRMNTLGGSAINLSGEDIYFYNTYQSNETSTACSLRFTGCAINGRKIVNSEPINGYFYNPTLLDDTQFSECPKINFLLPYKINDTQGLLYQYSPTENTVRCYEISALDGKDIMPSSIDFYTETQTLLEEQTKTFNEVYNDKTYTYDVISDLAIKLSIAPTSNLNKNISLEGISSLFINEEKAQESALKNNGTKFTNLKIDTKYTINNSIKYKWYNAETKFGCQTVTPEFLVDYDAQGVSAPHGSVAWMRQSEYNNQTIPPRAYIFIDFIIPNDSKKYPVSEYRIYQKNNFNNTAQVIATIRGNIDNNGQNYLPWYGYKYMSCSYIDDIATINDAKNIVYDNIYYIETVYANNNSNIRKTIKSEEFVLDQDVSSVETILPGNDIRVFPSRVKQNINIQSNEPIYNIQIYNSIGNYIRAVDAKGKDTVVIDVANLNEGWYILRINYNKIVKFLKL